MRVLTIAAACLALMFVAWFLLETEADEPHVELSPTGTATHGEIARAPAELALTSEPLLAEPVAVQDRSGDSARVEARPRHDGVEVSPHAMEWGELVEWVGSPNLDVSEAHPRIVQVLSESMDLQSISFDTTGTVLVNGQYFTFRPLFEDGPHVADHDNGKPKERGQHQHGRRVGLWTTWYDSGERESEGRYVHGSRHGLWTSWHANGERQSRGDYLYDKQEGPWSTWREDGSRQEETTFVNGQPDGLKRRWHANGKREAEWTFVFGKLHGPTRTWHENGELASRGEYRHGVQTDRWDYFDAQGVLDADTSGWFENGQKVRD